MVVAEEAVENRNFNPYKSHWLFSLGFEGLKYEVPFEFAGVEKTISPKDQELWGGRLGIGGELYLGAGFMTATKLEGYYVGTLFARRLNAGPDDEDEEFAFTKRTGQVYGFDLSQSLGYLFNMKTKNPIMDEWTYLTVEPFIEAGIGIARAYNRIHYDYNTGPADTDEGYRHTIEDELVNARFGGGINFTSNQGYFFFMKAYVNTFDITKRKNEIYTRENQQASQRDSFTEKDVKIDPITSYSIGGGYKF